MKTRTRVLLYWCLLQCQDWGGPTIGGTTAVVGAFVWDFSLSSCSRKPPVRFEQRRREQQVGSTNSLHSQEQQQRKRNHELSSWQPTGLPLYKNYYNSTDLNAETAILVVRPPTLEAHSSSIIPTKRNGRIENEKEGDRPLAVRQEMNPFDEDLEDGSPANDQQQEKSIPASNKMMMMIETTDADNPTKRKTTTGGSIFQLMESPKLQSEYQKMYRALREEQVRIDQLRIDQLETKIHRLEQEKESKEKELRYSRSAWEHEQNYLMNLLANCTALRQKQTDELDRDLQWTRETCRTLRKKQERLQEELSLLDQEKSDCLARTGHERERVEALEKALADVRAQAEKGMENFQRRHREAEKRLREDLLKSEKKLSDFEHRSNEQRKALEAEREDLRRSFETTKTARKDQERKVRVWETAYRQGNAELAYQVKDAHSQVKHLKERRFRQALNSTEEWGETNSRSIVIQEEEEEEETRDQDYDHKEMQEKEKEWKGVRNQKRMCRMWSDYTLLTLGYKREQLMVKQFRMVAESRLQRKDLGKALQDQCAKTRSLEEEVDRRRASYRKEKQRGESEIQESLGKTAVTLQTWRNRYWAVRAYYIELAERTKRSGRRQRKDLHGLFDQEVRWSEKALREWHQIAVLASQRQGRLEDQAEALIGECERFVEEWDALEWEKFRPPLALANEKLRTLQTKLQGLDQRVVQQEEELYGLENSFEIIAGCAWKLAVERYQTAMRRIRRVWRRRRRMRRTPMEEEDSLETLLLR